MNALGHVENFNQIRRDHSGASLAQDHATCCVAGPPTRNATKA
jgi:hypothetical protein